MEADLNHMIRFLKLGFKKNQTYKDFGFTSFLSLLSKSIIMVSKNRYKLYCLLHLTLKFYRPRF